MSDDSLLNAGVGVEECILDEGESVGDACWVVGEADPCFDCLEMHSYPDELAVFDVLDRCAQVGDGNSNLLQVLQRRRRGSLEPLRSLFC